MRRTLGLAIKMVGVLCGLVAAAASAQDEEPSGPRLEVYGFGMTDSGFNFGTSDQNWFDVVRPTKLPAFPGQFGDEGRFFLGVRQSRLGVKTFVPSRLGELKVHLEAELFGVGDDAGRTTFRLRHAFGEVGEFGAGQTWSGFMDPDVFPNSIEYWGPSGMVFFRNVQIRWQRKFMDTHLVHVSLENPGGSADVDRYAGRIELEDVTPRFPAPDVAAHYKYTGTFGYVKLAGIFRYLRWDDLGTDAFDLSGHAIGWGFNLSSNINLPNKSLLKLQVVYGEAIQNYMNDADRDVGTELTGDPTRPLDGVGLPTLGTVAFLDWTWTEWMTSSIGHSLMWIDNSEGQEDTAFRLGHYALANVLFQPVKNFVLGPELQWGYRRNFRGDYSYDAFRVQFSMKYSFSETFPLAMPK